MLMRVQTSIFVVLCFCDLGLFVMASYSQIIMAPLRAKAIWQKCSPIYNPFSRFCSLISSTELPDWFRYPNGKHICVDSDDDFVLPTKLEFLEDNASGHVRATNCRAVTKLMRYDSFDIDVVEVSGIIKPMFTSPEDAFRALDHCNVNISTGLVTAILKRFSNDWISAYGFFLWAGTHAGYRHSSDCYDMMIDILGKSKQFHHMWGLIDEMVHHGSLVSLATMTKVMRRLAGAGRWGDAIRTFRKIKSFGVKKDTAAMNILLDTLCKEKSVKHARDAFMEFRAEVPPNASSFNSLIHGWCKARKIKEARRTMEEMKTFGFSPCVIAYTSLIEAYCVEKNFQMVDVVLKEMYAHGCPPNVVTYTIVMHSLGKAKEFQEALKIFERMKADGCAPDASFYNSLIYVLGRAGRLRDANNIYEEMCKIGISPNTTTFSTLISAACYHSQEDNALKLFFRMQELSCTPDTKTYTPLLKLCCKRRWTKILLYLLAHMLKKDISLDLGTYTLLIHGLCRNGKLMQSCLFFEEMVLKGLIPKQHTYNILIEALERKNMEGPKLKVEKLMLKAECMKAPDYRHASN